MAKLFIKNGAAGIGGGQLLLQKNEYRLTPTGWTQVQTLTGTPNDVAYHRQNARTLYPNAVDFFTREDQSPFWEVVITYGSLDPAETLLNSTWTIDGDEEELRISAHPNAVVLDVASPGWTRFIEYKIDLHYQTTPERKFDYTSIQSGALLASGGGAHTPTHGNYSLAQLNALAVQYAEAWERSVEAYLEPRWVIRNEVEVSAEFNYAAALVLYANINRMFTGPQLISERLIAGEVIPAGTIPTNVLYWMKKPFQKTQTRQNRFLINREYVGLNWFDPFLYSAASF